MCELVSLSAIKLTQPDEKIRNFLLFFFYLKWIDANPLDDSTLGAGV